MSDEQEFYIWYTDGEHYMGWLHQEGSHGRAGPRAEYTKERAEEQIALEKRAEPWVAFVMIPTDAPKAEVDRLVVECSRAARAAQQKRWV